MLLNDLFFAFKCVKSKQFIRSDQGPDIGSEFVHIVFI